jgi:hypothetical protein
MSRVNPGGSGRVAGSGTYGLAMAARCGTAGLAGTVGWAGLFGDRLAAVWAKPSNAGGSGLA